MVYRKAFYKKPICVLIVLLFLGISGLSARDTATFVDLGFSPDGRTFMFAQYGVQAGTLKPWADLFIVDVPGNNFVGGGNISYIHDRPVVFGQNGSGAFRSILVRNASLIERHRISHSSQGRPLFIALDNSASNRIEFRDFDTGAFFRATLFQTTEGTGAALRSSFFINVEREARDGTRRTYIVGTPNLKRPLIASYRIRQARIYGNSMIFVIEKERQEGANISIRYMVEALQL